MVYLDQIFIAGNFEQIEYVNTINIIKQLYVVDVIVVVPLMVVVVGECPTGEKKL